MISPVMVSAIKSPPIERVVVDAILAGRIQAGTRLGEQALADLFAVSRTTIREALIRLETHGIVQVIPRRGWFVVEPSTPQIHDAFHARLAVELGILRCASAVPKTLIEELRANIVQERAAIAAEDVSTRCFLACRFHITMAEALGNAILSDLLLYLAARTVPITALYQNAAGATESIDEHDWIVDAVEANNFDRAGELMQAHLTNLEEVVPVRAERNRLPDLRTALLPSSPKPQ